MLKLNNYDNDMRENNKNKNVIKAKKILLPYIQNNRST